MDTDESLVREAIDGYFGELDQNKCCSSAEQDEVEAERLAAHAALDRLLGIHR